MIRCRDQQKVFLLKWMLKFISDNDYLYKLSDLAEVRLEELIIYNISRLSLKKLKSLLTSADLCKML